MGVTMGVDATIHVAAPAAVDDDVVNDRVRSSDSRPSPRRR
jgi:hypothetical protein